MIRVATSLDPQAELAAFGAGREDAGALASFVGLCRNEDGAVSALELEHYPGFTEREIERIEGEARSRFAVLDVLIVHRTGRIEAGAPIVLVAVLAAHRKAALHAVDFLMDYLKTDAPFWKRETGAGGSRWVEPSADDYGARAGWKGKP
jgi:molybdopterin synthase catalytic subunit